MGGDGGVACVFDNTGAAMAQEVPPLRKAAVATGGLQQPVQSSVPMETEPSTLVLNGATKSSKKADKIFCFHCGKDGHVAGVCEAILCVYCERATHDAKD
jgi:hypothetical protein